MPGDGDDKRVESDGLQDRCHQDTRVCAGADLFLQQIRREADALSGALEACGRSRVDDALLAERVIHRRSLCPHSVGIAGLVAVEGGISGEFFEDCPGPRLYGGDLRRVRGDKGGDELRMHVIARPFVEGKEPYRIVPAEYRLGTAAPGMLHDRDVNHPARAFGGFAQAICIRRYHDVPEGHGASRRNHADRSPDLSDALTAY